MMRFLRHLDLREDTMSASLDIPYQSPFPRCLVEVRIANYGKVAGVWPARSMALKRMR